MKTKYFNDAIIGNKNLKATYSKKGELLRLYYPNSDYKQFIDEFKVGIKVNDSRLINLADDINNVYSQNYIEQTNILNTEITNTYFELRVLQTDFISSKEDILVKRYKFTNNNLIDLDISLLIHSKLLSNSNNFVSGEYKDNALIQYSHDYSLSIFSSDKMSSYQINNSENNINDGVIHGKDYIGMSSDSSVLFNIGVLKPNEEKTIDIIVSVIPSKEPLKIADENIRLKKLDIDKKFEETKKYWRNYLKKHDTINLPESRNEKDRKIKKVYERTILLFPLLYNYETGGISAAFEVDENLTKCGGYSYCWPRDAIFITKAMYELGMDKEVEKYYKSFCTNTQSKDGMWEQRFYTNGNLAPSWGYQIDETASIVYGVYDYYQHKQESKFLKDNYKMCEKAIHYLERYIDGIFNNDNTMQLSYDIWEEREDIHTYSIAAIFSAFDCMLKINDIVKQLYEGNRLRIEQINKNTERLKKYTLDIKKYILKEFHNNNFNCFSRNKTDRKMDISLLGLVYPFNIFQPKEKKIENTIERMNMTLRTYTGGYLRYEDDNYIGGNPWVIANLWMAEYYLKAGKNNLARECFDFAIISSNEHGFLPEQVDNNTMDAAWVIGLGWSHAMFINVLNKLYNR